MSRRRVRCVPALLDCETWGLSAVASAACRCRDWGMLGPFHPVHEVDRSLENPEVTYEPPNLDIRKQPFPGKQDPSQLKSL